MDEATQTDPEFQEANDSLYRSGATDGLPVVPPTEERVEEMLRGTDRPRDHEIGKLGNREGSLTIEKLATNAVMAGCRPIHMPVLIAGAEALADPSSQSIQFSVSVGSYGYFWLVNGPIRGDIDVASNTGTFGPNYRTNRTISRALGLAYKNTALIHPGEKDMAVMGSPCKYSFLGGENEEDSPWEPYHVTAGYDEDENTITLGGAKSFVQFVPYSMDPKGVLKGMSYNTTPDMIGAESETHMKTVVYLLSPYNAQELGDAGISKQEVKEYLCNNSNIPYAEFRSGLVIPDEAVGDPVMPDKVSRLQYPQFESPEYIKIAVVGGAGRFSGVTRTMGPMTTKKIHLPDDWEQLCDQYSEERTWGEQRGQ